MGIVNGLGQRGPVPGDDEAGSMEALRRDPSDIRCGSISVFQFEPIELYAQKNYGLKPVAESA